MPPNQPQERAIQSDEGPRHCVKIIQMELNEEKLQQRAEAKKAFECSIQRFYQSV